MNWTPDKIDVGTVPEMGTFTAVFTGNKDMPEIQEINPGCRSCTSYKYNKSTKRLSVSITLGQIPIHLSHQKTQFFKKIVTVKYKNGTLDVLEITGTKFTT